MKTGWGIGVPVVVAALLLGLLAAGAAAATKGGWPGTPDPSFGRRGRVVITLPDASTPGSDGSEIRSFARGMTVTVHGGNAIGKLAAALQPDGRLVLAGEKRAKGEGEGSELELLGLR